MAKGYLRRFRPSSPAPAPAGAAPPPAAGPVSLNALAGPQAYGNAEWAAVHREVASSFATLDVTNLQVPDAPFDIAWSLSSIQHFGGGKQAAQALREMARVLRPGGIAAVATKYRLFDEYEHPEWFTRRDVERYLIGATPDLELVEPMDWTLPPVEYLMDSVALRHGAGWMRRHIVLNDGEFQWTSIMLFFRRR